jgi:hypothetical protein
MNLNQDLIYGLINDITETEGSIRTSIRRVIPNVGS